MPKVYEEKIKLTLPKSHGRSIGLHVSEVIRDFAFTAKVLDAKWKTELEIELQDTHMMQLGMAWEDYLEKSGQFPEIEYHPGELSVRCGFCLRCGVDKPDHLFSDQEFDHAYHECVIYMSPDGFLWEDGVVAFLAEVKLTKKSVRDFAQGIRMGSKKSIMWIWQIAAYLKGMNKDDEKYDYLAAKLLVMFVNGDYSYDPKSPDNGAVKRRFRLEFTQEEVETIWRMLSNHAREMIRSGRYVCPVTA